MDAVKLGELVIQIRGDVTKLVEAQAQASASLDKIAAKSTQTSQKVQANVAAMAARFVAVVGTIAFMTNRAAQAADQLNRLSQQTGISAEKLSELKAVTESTGVEFSKMEQVIRGWNATVVETSQNVNSRAAIALRALGLEVREVMSLPFDQALRRIADALGPYEDGQKKAALATAILKEAGAELIPVLNLQSRGIDDAAAKARANGQVLSGEALAAAREYTKAWKELGTEINNILVTYGTPVLKWLLDVAKASRAFASSLSESWKRIRDTNALAALNKSLEDTNILIEETQKEIQQGQSGWSIFQRNTDDARKALDKLIEKQKQLKQQMLEQFGGGFINPPDDGFVPIPESAKPQPPPELPNIPAIREELDALIEELQGLPILFGEAFHLDPLPFIDAAQQIDAAVEKGAVTAMQASRMKLQLQRQEQDLILETANIAAQTLTTVFGKSKAAAIAAAIINTGVAVTRALSASPPPYNFIQAGLVAAAGAAQIASIRSTTQSGGAAAGVSGGGGGGAEETGGGLQQTLLVEGLREDQLLTGTMVRNLAERLLQYQRDGGEVVLIPRR